MAKAILSLLFFVLLASAELDVSRVNPGLQVVGSQKLFDHASQVAIKILQEKFVGEQLPDVSGSEGVPVIGTINYDLTSIRLERFELDEVSSGIKLGENIFLLNVNNLNVKVNLHWKYKKKSFPYLPKGSGDAEVSSSGANLQIKMSLGLYQGRPTFSVVEDPELHLSDFKIKTSGSLFSWLYNLILKAAKGTIRNSIEKAVRSSLNNILPEVVNKMLLSIPVLLDVKVGNLNISLAQPPHIEATHMLLEDYALFQRPSGMLEECPAAAFDFRGRSLGVAPYKVSDSPSLIEFIEKSDRMIRFVVREHVPQCFMWVAYHEGYLGQTLKDKDLDKHPEGMPRLNTADPMWLKSVPNLNVTHPDKFIQIKFSAIETPSVVMSTQNGIRLTVPTSMFLYVEIPDTEKTDDRELIPVFNLNGTIDVAAKVWIETEPVALLKVEVTILDLRDLKAWGSTIGEIDVSKLEVMLKYVTFVAKFILNVALSEGFPVPQPDHVAFVEPSIIIEDHLLTVETNIYYNP